MPYGCNCTGETPRHDGEPRKNRKPYGYDLRLLLGIPGGNRTHNYALGEHCYIHLTTETCHIARHAYIITLFL